MTDKEKIRAEIIKRRKAIPKEESDKRLCAVYGGIAFELTEILNFIDSMPEESVSEVLWEASKEYALRQVLASTDTEMTEQAYLDLKLFSGFEIAVAHKDGANWQKQQMMKEAEDGLVVCNELTHGYKDIAMRIPDNLEIGDKVKVIIIKELK